MFSWVSFASAGVSDFMRAAVRTRLKEAFEAGGTAAALVFLNYLRLKIHHPKHGSIRKAQWLTAAALAADQVRTAASLKPVQRSWARFRPVAHFWASFHLLRGSGEVRFETEEQALRLDDPFHARLRLFAMARRDRTFRSSPTRGDYQALKHHRLDLKNFCIR